MPRFGEHWAGRRFLCSDNDARRLVLACATEDPRLGSPYREWSGRSCRELSQAGPKAVGPSITDQEVSR